MTLIKSSGTTKSIMEGSYSHIYYLQKNRKYKIIRTYLNETGVTFSFFAKSLEGNIIIRIILIGPFSSQSKNFEIKNKWTRNEIHIINDIGLSPLDIYVINLSNDSRISIAFPQVEKGLKATSPIPPDIRLPSISTGPSSGDGNRRAADQLHTNNIALDSNASSIILVATPYYSHTQLMKDDFLSFVSLISSIDSLEITVGISGSHNSKFIVRTSKNYNDNRGIITSISETNIIGSNESYYMALIFDRNTISIIINGLIALISDLNKTYIFDSIYCCSSSSGETLGGHLMSFRVFNVPLLYPRILQIYREEYPSYMHYTYEYLLRYFSYSIISEDENLALESNLKDDGFNQFMSSIKFSLPLVFEQFPPQKKFTEEEVRDWVYALLKKPESQNISREKYTKIGRSDLTINFNQKDGEKASIYNIEFKIWNRSGYDKAPGQPLKYMSESDHVGAFFMIDRRKKPSLKDFKNIIENNIDYPCISIKEIHLIDTNINYFVSFHKDVRFKNLRMIVNFYLPIRDDS